MTKERSLDWWKDAIKNGIKFQESFGKSKMWSTYKSYYRHEFTTGILPVNMVFSVLRSMVPQVYFRDPVVLLTPTKPGIEFELHARLLEDIDNWLLRELNVKYQLKRMINDSFLCGISTGFTGYDSMYGFSLEHAVTPEGATLTGFNKKGSAIEYNSAVSPGMPWFLRARPEDTIFPWGCESVESAEWVAMRVFRPLSDVKQDPKYSNTSDLEGSYVKTRTTAYGSQPEHTLDPGLKDHDWVEIFQIHDAKERKVLCLVMSHDKFIRDDIDLLQLDGLPCDVLTFNPDPDYVYGIPDAKIIEPQLLELNEIRTQAMKHRRVDIVKMLYRKGALTKDAVTKLLDERVQAAVEVDADADLRNSVMPLTPGASGILADLERMGEVIRGDVRESVGFSRSSTGEYMGKTHITKAETDVVQWAGQIRIDERRDMVADTLSKLVRRMNQIVFTYWNQPMVRSIIGPDGARWWIKFTPSDIKAEYTHKIDPSNAIPSDQRTRRQDAMQMAQAWATMNAGMVKTGMPAPAEIQRYFFSQFDGINIDRALAQQQQMAQAAQAQQMRPGAGGNPEQALPPQEAARMIGQQTGALE